jgi:hypothetical protein
LFALKSMPRERQQPNRRESKPRAQFFAQKTPRGTAKQTEHLGGTDVRQDFRQRSR